MGVWVGLPVGCRRRLSVERWGQVREGQGNVWLKDRLSPLLVLLYYLPSGISTGGLMGFDYRGCRADHE